MNERLIKMVWCICIILTLLTSGWPIFNNDYMIVIWILSAMASIALTDVTLGKASYVDYDFQLSCSIIAVICVLFAIVFALVIVWGWLNEINDDFITLSKCAICILLPVGIITEHIASWKPKK